MCERERERERIVCVTKRTIVYDFTPKKKYTFPFCSKKVGILAFFLNDVLKIFFVFVLFIYLGKMVILWQNYGRIVTEFSVFVAEF